MSRRLGKRPWIVILGLAAVVIGALVTVWGIGRHGAQATSVPLATVGRQDIATTIEATGTVEPIDLIEVKSKASGQILRMPVEAGSVVRAGELLALIDTVDVQNAYAQALAALRAAQAKVDVSSAQMKRADELFAQQVITAEEHETATLDYANAQASLVKARTDLDTARQRRQDVIVVAPVAGTVLEQLVSTGQVIASATATASGGTTLLKMADLSRIRLRALVAETDIGNVRIGQAATVTVDAFPQKPFTGQVEKVEPQAVVEQSVTMFPVLIAIPNADRLLLPGMSGEVEMVISRRENALAVDVDAVRTVREAAAAATALGLDPDSVRAALRSSRGAGQGVPGMQRWAPGADSSARGARRGASGAGNRAPGAGGSTSDASTGSSGASTGNEQVVFLKTARGFTPRLVRIGLTNFDYAEVLSGLQEGDQVALLGVAEAQAERTEDQSRLRQRMSSGMGGVPGTRTTAQSSTSSSGGRSGSSGGPPPGP
jgi:HlyD family secretion protein